MPAAVPVGLVLPSEPHVPVPPPRYAKVTAGVQDFLTTLDLGAHALETTQVRG